jgi:putative membrane protein
MELLGVQPVVDPELTLLTLACIGAGSIMGTISGLIPGLHANNFALVLASVASSVPAAPLLVGVTMLAAGVVHTFVNVVPALALGVPDAETAVTTLPAHRLVQQGRGEEAIRLTALGSLLAVVCAAVLAVPVTRGMEAGYPTIMDNMALVLVAVVVAMIVAEPTRRAQFGGAIAMLASGLLGAVTLSIEPSAPLDAGGMLAPLFAGLFGAPILLDAMAGGGVPRQSGPMIRSTRQRVLVTALAGALAGAIVGYLPGISAAIAAVAVLAVLPGGVDDRGYVVATSGVDTANTIFALFALSAIGQPRTGVMVALQKTGAPVELPILLAAVALSGVVGFVVVLTVGDWYLQVVGQADYRTLSMSVIALLLVVSFLLAGWVGILAFCVATAIGLIPPHLGARRVHLMGVLIGPLVVSL